MSTTESTANATTVSNATKDASENASKEETTNTTKAIAGGEDTASGEKTENTEGGDKSGRFGIAEKPTSKISFRILTNLSLSFKPYAGQNIKNEFCIKPGGMEGSVKPFTSSSGRKQFKKVGIRISYTIKQLLSVREKFKTLPSEIEQIAGVFEEGLGDFETLTDQTITLSTTTVLSDKLTSSKLRKSGDREAAPSSKVTATAATAVAGKEAQSATTTTDAASSYDDRSRYHGNDEDASFRGKGQVTPSKLTQSKLKKREKVQTEEVIPEHKPLKSEPVVATEVQKPAKRESVEASTASTSAGSTPAKTSAAPLSAGRSRSAWGRARKQQDPMTRLTAQITIRLNKITLDNFDNLSEQIMKIFEEEIRNTEQLTKLVTLIFEKTVQEHVYGPLYAKLCVALSSKNKSFEEIAFVNGKKETKEVDFKNVLVKVCQTEFQKGKRKAVFTDEMDETDRENELIKQKKILMGTMKFIGQLYLKELLPSQIMTVCLRHLVGQQKPSEDDIEGACTLLETVGPTLDTDSNVNKSELTKYYSKLKQIERNNKFYTVRIRMLAQNLIDLRKSEWKGSAAAKAEGPSVLKDRKPAIAADTEVSDMMYDLDDALPFDMDAFMRSVGVGGGDDVASEIMASNVPLSGHVVGQSQRKFRSSNRYYVSNPVYPADSIAGTGGGGTGHQAPAKQQIAAPRKKGRGGVGGRRQLLQTAEEEEYKAEEFEEDIYDYGNEQESQPAPQEPAEPQQIGIGQRKRRTALGASSERPCDHGKALSEERMEELSGDYLYFRNNINAQALISNLITYQLEKRSQFVLKFIQKAIDGGKGERLANVIPKLLDEYILVANELDAGFIEFFKGYTYEDNPQLAMNTAQLLAPLIVDNELSFADVLQWILLDTRQHQDAEMLKFYDGDGMRNYVKSRTPTKITKVLALLGELLKELKEACFDDSQYVNKLLSSYNFTIDEYVNQNDLANKDEVQNEW
eukprot:CAMPEP_0197072268 /NCGR_PEP_ID=MMETSP1384-20130603/210010_1 /TAXON_ID=29189 /ORGANISM="Ammonia sp." /LENGTH=970 /DNA_ID=CAMNT_0042511085 /DNA_START=86 /DNA_END=2995 /DNA_ORIENTATION=-